MGTALTDLLEVDDNTIVLAQQRLIEAEMRAKDEVHRIVMQPVLAERNRGPEPLELIAKKIGLIEQTERMHIAKRLDDAQVNGRQGIHAEASPQSDAASEGRWA